MKREIKHIIQSTPLFDSLLNGLEKKRQVKEIENWERRKRPVPPPHIIKQRILIQYANKYRLKVLVETGTYYGDMVEAMKNNFDLIYSIELSKKLFDIAKKRFRKASHIELINGDSGKELGKLMNMIGQPALFWLDGHYSEGVTARGEKDTPIYEELHHIFRNDRNHVIIIDDARCFGTDPAYPTLEELKEFIKSMRENVSISVQDDSIRVTPCL